MKIYTRTGDDGTTGLFGGGRVPKSHPLIAAYGTVDELNAWLGLARTQLLSEESDLETLLQRLQGMLFEVGADLATPLDSRARTVRIKADHIDSLEREIDRLEAQLPPLKTFILPGGAPAAATLHVARTVCRRAERLVVEALQQETLNPEVLRFLNRLSDLLFVLARWVNHRRGTAETPWMPEKHSTA
ncbi:cob(I)yrinic acid a,c-diamide adenosyltransferase [Rhodothermus profundi]|uniref:Corrinoid adenosyltransferase n=1 Tax=Rhodothermus profundi TaxID=633813 RepID=A0A1M6WVE3_9BACT|nr:cob(I)yrinic acid a,c-diamide adenosyltransferase [Rhodothermus profundi]SHK97525.1 ATP:cob(I)alamin adenosyltransferase [Rhodothermus profundi]